MIFFPCAIDSQLTSACTPTTAIYQYLELDQEEFFPESVRSAITTPTAAKYYRYGDKQCVHVVGPDFRLLPDVDEGEAMDYLTASYANVCRELVTGVVSAKEPVM